MKKFSLLTLILLFSAFMCLGAGTALGSNGNINSASLDVNLGELIRILIMLALENLLNSLSACRM